MPEFLETHQKLALVDANVPTAYHIKSLSDAGFGGIAKDLQKLLKDIGDGLDTFPNTLVSADTTNYELFFAVVKSLVLAGSYTMYGNSILVASLEDILKARMLEMEKLPEPELDKPYAFYKLLVNNPKFLFIPDFVTEDPSFDESNIHLKTYTGYEYRILNTFIRGRLENEDLTTVLYSASTDISHCWSKLLIQIINRKVDLNL